MSRRSLLFFCWFIFFLHTVARSQGDGARSFLLAPKGVSGINAKWIHLNSNLIPAGTLLIPQADINVDVFPITLFHTFSLGGRFAQVYAMVNPGSATAKTAIGPPIGPLPINSISASGLSDGFVAGRIGLAGAQALPVAEFAASPMTYSLFADVKYWYSGSYDADKLFNLGTNRGTFQIGLPMAIPLNKNRKRATWVELFPSVQFFGKNDDPARSSRAEEVTQKPLYILETHLSHNFSPKFWASMNLRWQEGGRSSVDGVPDDNNISVLGGGLAVGYQIAAPFTIVADYGTVIASDNTNGSMFRISAMFAYAKLKK
jgi:hypothetical protein